MHTTLGKYLCAIFKRSRRRSHLEGHPVARRAMTPVTNLGAPTQSQEAQLLKPGEQHGNKEAARPPGQDLVAQVEGQLWVVLHPLSLYPAGRKAQRDCSGELEFVTTAWNRKRKITTTTATTTKLHHDWKYIQVTRKEVSPGHWGADTEKEQRPFSCSRHPGACYKHPGMPGRATPTPADTA